MSEGMPVDYVRVKGVAELLRHKWVVPVLDALRPSPAAYTELRERLDIACPGEAKGDNRVTAALSLLNDWGLVVKTEEGRPRWTLTPRARQYLLAVDAMNCCEQ